MTVDDIINGVIEAEGDYSDNPNDAGGPTRWGVTQAVARADGYKGDMRDYPRASAVSLYTRRYVTAPGFGRILALSQIIAAELVDTGVNMGPPAAGKFLQRALNMLELVGLVVDGEVGDKSIAAFETFLKHRGADGEQRLRALLNAQQGTRYLELAEGRAANRSFLFGWLKRIL